MGETGSAHRFGEVTRVKPHINGFLFYIFGDFAGHLCALLDQIFMRINLFFNKAAHRVDDHLLLFAQSKIHKLYSSIADFRAFKRSATSGKGGHDFRVLRLTCSMNCSQLAKVVPSSARIKWRSFNFLPSASTTSLST